MPCLVWILFFCFISARSQDAFVADGDGESLGALVNRANALAEELAGSAVDDVPFSEDVIRRAVDRKEAMTLFVVRIQKSGSSSLEALFGVSAFSTEAHLDADARLQGRQSPACATFTDCGFLATKDDPLLTPYSIECSDRGHLLHLGHFTRLRIELEAVRDKTNAQRHLLREIKLPRMRFNARRRPTPTADCVNSVYSYCFVERFEREMSSDDKDVVSAYFAGARVVSGHMAYGLHTLLPSRKGRAYAYVTAVRDPVLRVISQWNWWVFNDREPIRKSVLDDWLKGELKDSSGWPSDYGDYMVRNHQTRVICGYVLGEGRKRGVHHEYAHEGITKDGARAMTRADLECAKSHLRDDFILVIALGELKKTPGLEAELRILIASLLLDIPPAWLSQRVNSNKTPPDVKHASHVKHPTAAQRTLIEDANALDMELYAYSAKLFAKQLDVWRRLYRELQVSSLGAEEGEVVVESGVVDEEAEEEDSSYTSEGDFVP